MRQLEVVAVSDDGTHLLLAASEDAARATHQLRIDNRLVAAINGELDDDAEHRESELSPKEIQARLRAGETVEAVAKAARIPVARIMIYATPVLSERDRIVDQARAAKLSRPRGPETTVPLGEMVTQRLAEVAGLRPETVEWSAKRREDGAWVISMSYGARGGTRTASWLWRPNGRVLTSLNALGTRLGSAEAPPAPRKPKPRSAPAPAAPVRRTPAKRTAKAAASAQSTTRAPRKAAAKPAPRKPRPAPREAPRIEPQRTENGRVVMPSWDDVLLGVTGAPATGRGRRRS